MIFFSINDTMAYNDSNQYVSCNDLPGMVDKYSNGKQTFFVEYNGFNSLIISTIELKYKGIGGIRNKYHIYIIDRYTFLYIHYNSAIYYIERGDDLIYRSTYEYMDGTIKLPIVGNHNDSNIDISGLLNQHRIDIL